jgi:hypothetical protein
MRGTFLRSVGLAGVAAAALALLAASDPLPSHARALPVREAASAPAASAPATAPAPRQTLAAGIYGADVVPYGTWCYYSGWASGGTPPYTVAWISVGGLDDEWWSGNQYGVLTSSGGRSIEMWMTVRDAANGYVEVLKMVDKNPYASC